MCRAIVRVSIGALAAVCLQLTVVNAVVASSKSEIPTPLDPIALYGGDIQFDVFRDGQEVGWHRVRFRGNGATLTVESSFKLQIDMLFLTLFRYRYEARETWQDGQLARLIADVDDDGTAFALEAERRDDRLSVTTENGRYSVEMPVYPTNHWHVGVLGANRVLNTLTGRMNRVEIAPAGRQAVETERGRVMAMRYAYSGELETEVWYDDEGRWVKMRFLGRDGSIIEYACRRCQGGAAVEAQR